MGETRKRRKRSQGSAKPKAWIIVLGTILLIGAILFGTYYLVANTANSSYVTFLKTVKTNVDKTNTDNSKLLSQIEDLNHKDSESIRKLVNSIQNNLIPLDKSIKELDSFNPIPKYSEQFNAFRDGVIANKKIYSQSIAILQNPGHKDVMNALAALQELINETNKKYESSKLGKIHITLPNEILNLSGTIEGYATKAFNDLKAKETLQSQYTKYFDDMEKVVNDFQAAKTPVHESVDSMGSGKKTIGDIYIEIDKKLVEISSIKASYDAISIPSKLATKHKKLDSIIKGYFIYCQDFKALLTEVEEAEGDEAKMTALGESLGQLDVKYEEISLNFANYSKEFKDDKYFYQDLNNL